MIKHPLSPNGLTYVILDTCVLLPARLSDVLFDLMLEKLYFLLWTRDVEQEFLRNWATVHTSAPRAGPRRLAAFQRATRHSHLIVGHHRASYITRVPNRVDQQDKHLIAAALVILDACQTEQKPCSHQVILVSDNTRHLAVPETEQLGVRIHTASRFLNRLFESEPTRCQRAITRSLADLKNPPYSKQQLISALRLHKAHVLALGLEAGWKE